VVKNWKLLGPNNVISDSNQGEIARQKRQSSSLVALHILYPERWNMSYMEEYRHTTGRRTTLLLKWPNGTEDIYEHATSE